MNLRWRLTLATAAVGAIVALGGTTGALLATQLQMRHQIDETLRTRIAHDPDDDPSHHAQPPPAAGVVARDDHPYGCGPGGRGVPNDALQIVSAKGNVTACGTFGALPVDPQDRRIATQTSGVRIRSIRFEGKHYRVMTAAIGRGTAVMSARDLRESDSILARLRARLGLLGVIATAAAAASGWLIARRIVRPVEKLRAATDRIATTEDLRVPVDVEGKDEIASLATSFNTMIGALTTSREQQARLIADASHELRTPLTSLRTNAELLQRARNLAPEQQQEVLSAVVAEVGELTDLVSELVELARDGSAADEALTTAELSEIARDVAERTRRRTKRPIEVITSNPVDVDMRVRMIDRALTNLVGNAVKYSPSPLPISITVNGRRVEVRDHGAGIAAEDLPHVFDRFYRAIGARSAPGSGLGLAIVQRTVSLHGGTVFAGNAPDGGAVVGFELPAPRSNSTAPRSNSTAPGVRRSG